MSRAERIRSLLEPSLRPVHLEIINESHQHSVKPGSETHFKVVIATGAFEGKSRIDRHRAINALLKPELERGLHALTLSTFSENEWSASPQVMASPACLGGSRADKAGH